MENRIQTCFHDRTGCKIHSGCVLMDKYIQVVPWSKIIVYYLFPWKRLSRTVTKRYGEFQF